MNSYWLEPKWDTGLILTDIAPIELQKKGIKTLLIDVDGTLIPGNQDVIDKSVIKWINVVKKDITLHLFSNNPSKKRVMTIAKELGLGFTYAALKPRKTSLLKVIKKLNLEISSMGIVGDRIFTDVLAGNRLGIYTILVKPMGENGEIAKTSNLQNIEIFIAKLIRKLIS